MRICQYCNKSFEPIYKNQVYCCWEHSRLGKLKRQKEYSELRKTNSDLIGICKNCGKKFKITSRRKYCSSECVHLFRNKSRRKPHKTSANTLSKPSEQQNLINYTKQNKNVSYNGFLIQIINSNNSYCWIAYKDSKKILQSAENFTTFNDCLKDAKSAF